MQVHMTISFPEPETRLSYYVYEATDGRIEKFKEKAEPSEFLNLALSSHSTQKCIYSDIHYSLKLQSSQFDR